MGEFQLRSSTPYLFKYGKEKYYLEMYPKTMIFIATVGVSLSLLLGLFSVITLEVVALSVMVFIGIPTLMTQVNIKPKEEERKQEKEVKNEKKEILRDETIRVSPQYVYYYEFELKRGEVLKGEISSDNHIDIYFVNSTNFKKWDKKRTFDFEYCNESVLKTKIDYEVPRRGTWFLLMENNGRKTAIVKVCLYLSD